MRHLHPSSFAYNVRASRAGRFEGKLSARESPPCAGALLGLPTIANGRPQRGGEREDR